MQLTHFQFLLFLLSTLSLQGQVTQTYSGLKRTQLSYLHANLPQLSAADQTDQSLLRLEPEVELTAALEQTRQELLNLPVFHRADYEIDVSGADTTVHWQLAESRTLFPLFNFGGVRGNFHYLLGFNDIHWQGRGQQLTAFYQNNDGQHNYYLALRNPSLGGSRWGYRLESGRYAAIEPLYFPEAAVNYRYANLNFGLSASYRFRPRQELEWGITIFQERYRKLEPEENSPGPDNVRLKKLLFKGRHQLNRLDFYQERLAGTDHQTIAQAVVNLHDNTRFFIAWHDFRWFQLVGAKGNVAARLRAGVSTNDNSPFAPFVLDSQVNIRGSGNRIDRGTAQLILNLEYRHRIWRDRRERFAIQLVAFSDIGGWRSPGGSLEEVIDGSTLREFVGLGTRILSLQASNAVIRVDYGVDLRNTAERGLVVGFGQYF
ncbi:MAG: BamA/TamA family outer membrane protein [Bacteroidota bacterium]